MMGLKERAFAPLVSVSLEELVPQDHFYRHLQKVLDLSFVYDLVRESYAMVGRPSVDPVVFFKLQLVMFFEDIRSERLLMRQVADRLSVRWYIGYDLDEPLPDHSTSARFAGAMDWKSFDDSSRPSSNDVKRPNWCGAGSCTSTRRKSMPMRIWIRLSLVLRLRREKLSKNILLPFLRQNQESRRTLRQATVTKGLPNTFQWMPLPHRQ